MFIMMSYFAHRNPFLEPPFTCIYPDIILSLQTPLGALTLCTSTMFPSKGRPGTPSPPLFPEEPLDIPEDSAPPPASPHASSGPPPPPHDWEIALGAAAGTSAATPTHHPAQEGGPTSVSADLSLGTSQQHLWTASFTDQECFSPSVAAAAPSPGAESACPVLGGFAAACTIAEGAAASLAPDAQGFRRRKLKAYQLPPQTDPEMELKRLRALKAFKARQKTEQEERKLRMRTRAVESEVDRLRSEISEK